MMQSTRATVHSIAEVRTRLRAWMNALQGTGDTRINVIVNHLSDLWRQLGITYSDYYTVMESIETLRSQVPIAAANTAGPQRAALLEIRAFLNDSAVIDQISTHLRG